MSFCFQSQHYQQSMPEVFHHLQELDEKRIKNIKNFMLQSVDIERNVFPIIDKCLDGITTAANEINEKEVRIYLVRLNVDSEPLSLFKHTK